MAANSRRRATARATVRRSPEDESKKIGEFQPGELIQCCEPVAGRVQALTAPKPASKRKEPPPSGGWLKLVTAKGKDLLEKVCTPACAAAAAACIHPCSHRASD